MKNRPIACCLSAARSILTHALLTLQVLSERRRLVAVTFSVAALAGATAAAGKDLTPADKGNGLSVKEEQYLRTYERCWKEFKHQCGRNLLESAWSDDAPVPDARVEESTATMENWLNPPEPTVAVSGSDYAASATTAPAYSATGTSWDSVAACESGGNWSASTGNGYYGGLQFDSGTWDAYGDSQYAEASDAPASAQIAAAESMPYDGWPNC